MIQMLQKEAYEGLERQNKQNPPDLHVNAVHKWRSHLILIHLVKGKRRMHDRHSKVMHHKSRIPKLDIEIDGVTLGHY